MAYRYGYYYCAMCGVWLSILDDEIVFRGEVAYHAKCGQRVRMGPRRPVWKRGKAFQRAAQARPSPSDTQTPAVTASP